MAAIDFPSSPSNGLTHTDANYKVWVYSSAKNRWKPAPTVETTIIDGNLNAVSGNAVFDALALKAPLASPAFTGSITAAGVSNTLPNQTAATSASILTRQLADDRYLINDNASSIIGLALFL